MDGRSGSARVVRGASAKDRGNDIDGVVTVDVDDTDNQAAPLPGAILVEDAESHGSGRIASASRGVRATHADRIGSGRGERVGSGARRHGGGGGGGLAPPSDVVRVASFSDIGGDICMDPVIYGNASAEPAPQRTVEFVNNRMSVVDKTDGRKGDLTAAATEFNLRRRQSMTQLNSEEPLVTDPAALDNEKAKALRRRRSSLQAIEEIGMSRQASVASLRGRTSRRASVVEPSQKLAAAVLGEQAAVRQALIKGAEAEKPEVAAAAAVEEMKPFYKRVIHPLSPFRFYWDLAMSLCTMYIIIALPVSIAFFLDGVGVGWFAFNVVIDALFIVDIFVNLRTGYIEGINGEVVMDPKRVAKAYMRSWFLVDFLSSIPLDYIADIGGGSDAQGAVRISRALKLIRLLRVAKLLRISRMLRYLARWEGLVRVGSTVFGIAKLLFSVALFLHWNACVQYLVAELSDFPPGCWVRTNNVMGESPFVLYSWAVFIAISNMIACGYGQLPPQILQEAWVNIVSILFGAIIYAIFIGKISVAVLSIDAAGRAYEEKMSQVDQYLFQNNFPLEMRRKVQEYYEHRYTNKRLYDEATIVQDMSPSLQKELALLKCADLVKAVPFLQQGSKSFVTAVVCALQFHVFMPGDWIVEEGMVGQEMFFIRKGTVEVFCLAEEEDPTHPKRVVTISEGAFFGEIAVLSNNLRRSASVRAKVPCDIYTLSKSDLHAILLDFPEMGAILKKVAAERLQNMGGIENVDMAEAETKHTESFASLAFDDDDAAEQRDSVRLSRLSHPATRDSST